MKKLVSVVAFLFLIPTIETKAQVGIGATNPSGALDITSTDNGLLIPRVALTNTTTVLPVLTGTTSELVYNTATINDVTPGFYYLSTTTGPWVRLATTAANPWSLTENSGTNPANNFIGTTDAQDLRFRRANQWAGTIASSVTSFGAQAGRLNTSTNNVFFGSNAGELSSNAASSNMVAIGHQAMGAAGAQNVSQSVAIGSFAMQSPTATAN